MSNTTLRQMADTREAKFGTGVFEFDSPGIGHILKAGGAEYAFVDCEHSGLGIDAVKRVLRYMEAAELPTFVRPPSQSSHHIATFLDAGAEGLMLPMVSNTDQARAIVDAMKYTPQGSRGVALGIAHDRYAPGPVLEKLAEANQRTVCLVLIETKEGIANVDEIAAVEGVDVLWIGHFDLSCSLGIPGQFEHPEFLSAVEKVVAAGQAQGKSLGRMVRSIDEGVALNNQGFDFICYSGDLWLLQDALRTGIEKLRERCG
jgi:2-dehydro-3-deoxyglucarate aldolase/4-hydroxy-2-oxoheptanedioate aldolase